MTAALSKAAVALSFAGGFLRPLTDGDVHTGYVNGLNDPDVNKFLVAVREQEQTRTTVTDFVRNSIARDDEILFGIWVEGEPLHCGTVRLHGIEHRFRTAMIGVCIFDKRVWGRGLGAKAIKAVTDWAHGTPKIRWIEAGTWIDNVASQKAFVAAGYEWVYDIPDKYLFEGRPTAVKMYASRAR